MAKTDAGGGGSWISVTVAFVAVAVFFLWMATREPPEAVAVAEPGDEPADTAGSGATGTLIEPSALVETTSARGLIGQDIELASVAVSDVLGTEMFWIELPGGAPYLVKMDSAQIASGVALPAQGSNVRVIGSVLEKTPELLDRWTASGALANPDQRSLAEYGSTFIAARRVQPAGG
jgi:hypothetical protein